MLTIVYESHSASTDNETGLASGHYDAELSPRGREQAKALGVRYAQTELSAIFCSDLRRSYETAEIAFAGCGLPIIQDSRLRECDYGALTRHPRAEVGPAKVRYLARPFPGGESYQQVVIRVKSFLQDLLAGHDGERVMIVDHTAVPHVLEHLIRRVPLHDAVAMERGWQPGWIYQLDASHLGDDE